MNTFHTMRLPLARLRCYLILQKQLPTSASLYKVPSVMINTSVQFLSNQQREVSLSIKCPIDVNFIERHIQELKRYDRKGDGDVGDVEILLQKVKNAAASEKDELNKKLSDAMLLLPNTMHPDVPIGDESKANVIELIGNKPCFDFKPKNHVTISENLDIFRGRNLGHFTGHRSYYLIGAGVELEQALIRFTFDRILKKGFQCISVPDIVHPLIFEGCGMRTSGLRTQVYHLDSSCHGDYCLTGTSEVSIAGYYVNQKLRNHELPQRLAAISRCYRAETAHTAEARGLYRVHQFTKVEMFGVTADKNQSDEMHQEFLSIEKELYTELGLYFRVLDMPSEELGLPAYRKFDIEAWMPGRDSWGEISSTSNCTDYQSRRLNIKYCDESGGEHYVNTVNGTACAVPRMIIAILETYQQEDGSVRIPAALQPYMKGQQLISKTSRQPLHFCRF
ncbi:serine--tRNA ligase, mitochondrial-like [Glandiceps talaboti]